MNEHDWYIKRSIFFFSKQTNTPSQCNWVYLVQVRHHLNAELCTRGQNTTSESFHPCGVIVTLCTHTACNSDAINRGARCEQMFAVRQRLNLTKSQCGVPSVLLGLLTWWIRVTSLTSSTLMLPSHTGWAKRSFLLHDAISTASNMRWATCSKSLKRATKLHWLDKFPAL
jgi:hypothetical protein